MKLIQRVAVRASEIGAVMDVEQGKVDVWAPDGMFWKCSGTHCLCSMSSRDELSDLLRRMNDGLGECCQGGCNRDCEWALISE